ncbi:glycosyltransferase [Arthrobacter sp. UYCu723]
MQNQEEILVLGTADWNQPIATNQHYMVRELAKEYKTTFVESLGLRKPEINSRDLRRMAKRLIGSSGAVTESRPLPVNVSIISPKVIPLHVSPWNTLNRAILNRRFQSWAASPRPVFWTYSPVTYGFEAAAAASFYHCVDLYGAFPGIDSKLIDREERRLAETGITAVGSSQVVVEHLESLGFGNVIFWPNVADTEVIRQFEPGYSLDRQGALFAGNLSEKKVDFNLLGAILDAGVELHLAGPVAEGGGASRGRLEDLIRRGAKYHGVLGLPELSKLMMRCKVGLIPYLMTSYTQGVSPLKTYEYLAAGLAVISTPIPGVKHVAADVFVETNSTEFVRRVELEVSAPIDLHVSRRINVAEKHSWSGRGKDARSLVANSL